MCEVSAVQLLQKTGYVSQAVFCKTEAHVCVFVWWGVSECDVCVGVECH